MFFTLHISLMPTATLGIIAGVSAAMFFRKKKSWLKIHKTVNSFSLLGMAAGIIMAFIYVSGTDGKHIDGIHQITGLTAVISSFATLLLGFYQFKAKNHGYETPKQDLETDSKTRCGVLNPPLRFRNWSFNNKLAVRTTHRWLGRFSLLLILTAITLGLILII
jgi:glucan phosphoethanolaminetransferase (alkaline phosphatase superfamily)